MSANFNVQFRINEKTQTRVIRLTDTSTGFTLAKGNFSVTFPDGSTRIKTEWSSPDITSPAAFIDILAVTDNDNNVITGSYKIDFIALNASNTSYSASKTFDFNWVKPINSIVNLSDVLIPEVKFQDTASYSLIGSFTGTLNRTFSASFPTTSEASGSSISTVSSSIIDMVSSGKYYDGTYTPSSDISINYTHSSNSWLTINYVELFTKTILIKRCPTQIELINKINSYRAVIEAYKEKNDTQFNILSEQYDLAVALYSHIIARYETSTQDGSEGQLRELLSILEPYSTAYTPQLTRMLPFELAVTTSNSFSITDGTNTDNVQLGGTLLFSSGNPALSAVVSNNQVTFIPTFGTANNTFAQGNDSRFHNAVTIATANGLSLASQALSLATATPSSSGAMSAADKAKLDGIAAGANVGTVTSIGISVPSAFAVSNSPITSSGVINISATGNPLQYITGAGALATLNTGAVPESGNLYFTNTRARTAISVSGSLSYNSTTGVISYIAPSETDPIFVASPSYGITNTNISNWNTAYGWGNHASAGYLTSFTETDPIYVASSWYSTTNNSSNWNTAYGWGNHALAGYLTSSLAATTYQPLDADLTAIAGLAGTSGLLRKTAANTWSLDTNTYLTSFTETDPIFVASAAYGITSTNISNWNTAYGWGNHASVGYLTSINSSQVTTALGFTPENAANKGIANGYASLDGAGLVPSTQLPSYVDDVLEYTNLAGFPVTGTTGKIYVALDTNKIYRWSGTAYIEVSPTVGTIWGGITGTLANQTDLQSALDAKQNTLTLTTLGTSGAATLVGSTLNIPQYQGGVTSFNTRTGAITLTSSDVTTALTFTPYNATNPSGYIALTALSSTATGLSYNNTTGVFSFASGYAIPTTIKQSNWDDAYTWVAAFPTQTGNTGKYLTTDGSVLSWATITAGVSSFNTRTGAITLTSSDVTTALGYTPVTNARTLTINGTTYDLTANRSWTIVGSMPSGGTAGQILSKIDATDYNTQWIDNFAEQVKHDVKLGATLAKGKAVYVSGSDGTNMVVSAASNASESTSSKVIGLLETGGVTNDFVKVVTEGLVAGLDTSTATAGDPVWLGTSGNLIFGLANKPVAPAHLVYIGVVTRVQSNNGEIFVNVQNGFEIEELHNVLFTSKADKDLMYYDNATSLWKNAQLTTVLGYTPYNATNPNNYIALTALSSTATGLTYTNTTGVFSLTSGYVIPTTSSASNWDTAFGWGNHASAGYLTTSSAASTYQPLDADLTAIAALTGTSGLLRKTAANTWSLDTNTYLTSITSSNVTTALGYTPVTNARTLTINGTTFDLSADRSWTVSGSQWTTSGSNIYYNTGSVGIGTTSPASYDASGNNLVVYEAGNAGITIATGATNFGSLFFARETGTAGAYRGYIEYGQSADYMAFGTVSAERIRITSGGSVGVGTSSPDTYSNIGSGIGFTVLSSATNTSANLNLVGNGTGFGGISLGNATIRRAGIFGLDGSALTFFTNTTNSGTNLAEAARFTSTGSLLVNATSNAYSEKLVVRGSASSMGLVRFENAVNQGDVNHGTLIIVNTANYAVGNDASISFALQNATNSFTDPRASIGAKTESSFGGAIVFNTRSDASTFTEKARITGAGLMGINTTAPTQRLTLNQGANGFNQGIPATSGTTQNGILRIQPAVGTYGETLDVGVNVNSSYAWLQSTNAGNLGVNYSLALNPNGGNVGINTASPSTALQVNGTVTATTFSGAGTSLTGTANSLNIGGSAGTVGGVSASQIVFGNGPNKTNGFSNANDALSSGFYNAYGASNMPYVSWFHLITTRHDNVNNNFQMQFAAEFWDANYWLRKVTGSSGSNTAWARIVQSVSDPFAANMDQYVRTTDGVQFGSIRTGGSYTSYHASFKPANNVVFSIGQSTGNGSVAGPFVNATRNGISDTTSVPLFFNCESFNVFTNYDQKLRLEPVYGDLFIRGFFYNNNTNWSDLRMKQNLKQITDPLTKIKALNGYTFEWREWTGYRNTPELVERINDAGLIAQEVEAVLPEIVENDARRDQKSMNYNGIIALHTEGIKKLIEENEVLLKRVEELESKLL